MLKIEENEECFNSPSYIYKNSTHDNKIFEANSFRQTSENIFKKSKDVTPLGKLILY